MHLNADASTQTGVEGGVEAGDTDDNNSPWDVSSDSEAGHSDPHHVSQPIATSTSAYSTVTNDDNPRYQSDDLDVGPRKSRTTRDGRVVRPVNRVEFILHFLAGQR